VSTPPDVVGSEHDFGIFGAQQDQLLQTVQFVPAGA
jgi:hypothetical protein